MFIGTATFFVPFFAIRLLLVGLGWVTYFLFTPAGLIALGILSMILVGILGRNLELKEFKTRSLISIILLLAISCGFAYVGNDYVAENFRYYEAHNGRSMDTADTIELGDSCMVYLNSDAEKNAYYFKFTPTQKGEYTFYTSSAYYSNVTGRLYSKKGEILAEEGVSSSRSSFKITYKMSANQTYYLRVGYNASYVDGCHYKVYCTKTN